MSSFVLSIKWWLLCVSTTMLYFPTGIKSFTSVQTSRKMFVIKYSF